MEERVSKANRLDFGDERVVDIRPTGNRAAAVNDDGWE